jgi:hypothetical protein
VESFSAFKYKYLARIVVSEIQIYRAERVMDMLSENESMSSPGPDRATTTDEVLEIMAESERPAWSATQLANYIDVSRPTANNRLKELQEDGRVQTIDLGNVNAYYVDDEEPESFEEELRENLRREFEKRFVGLPSAPWTAVNPEHGAAEAGSEVQLVVSGAPGGWQIVEAYPGPELEALTHEKTAQESTQALISGSLYAEPTTPIEHIEYPDEPDLETQLGVKIELVGNKAVLIADGVSNHLLRPCNDAVFLEQPAIDDISPKGEGKDTALPRELLDTHPTRAPTGDREAEIDRQVNAMFDGLDEQE